MSFIDIEYFLKELTRIYSSGDGSKKIKKDFLSEFTNKYKQLTTIFEPTVDLSVLPNTVANTTPETVYQNYVFDLFVNEIMIENIIENFPERLEGIDDKLVKMFTVEKDPNYKTENFLQYFIQLKENLVKEREKIFLNHHQYRDYYTDLKRDCSLGFDRFHEIMKNLFVEYETYVTKILDEIKKKRNLLDKNLLALKDMDTIANHTSEIILPRSMYEDFQPAIVSINMDNIFENN